MLHLCEKCGAPTRWYDEKCPRCGATRTVEIPTAAIALPNFASTSTRRDPAPVPPAPIFPSFPPETPQEKTTPTTANEKTPQEKTTPTNEKTPQEKTTAPNEKTPQEKTTTANEKTPQEKAATANEETPQEKTTAPNEKTPQEKTTAPNEKTPQEKTTTANEKTPQEKTTAAPEKTPRKRSQRLAAFQRAVDVWLSTLASETASITIPRGRAVRYALGIAVELFVCLPCAILAARFFTRALFAERRADYRAAIFEMERTRRTLVGGLVVFAAFLCAFIFYVQSQEVTVPTESGPTSNLFRN